MSGLRLKLRAAPSERLDLSRLVPGVLATLSLAEIGRLPVGTTNRVLNAGDVFEITGLADGTVTFEGGSDRFDFLGAGNDGGTIIVAGDVGAYCGSLMKRGRIEIHGNAGNFLASGLKGGVVTVNGSARDNVGGLQPGERFGMTGGTVVVEGMIGERAGDRMRRGTIITRSTCGAMAGSRMVGGTIWAEGGLGQGAGTLMRRGTLIAPKVEHVLPTFVDCGRHDLVVLRVMSRALSAELGPLAPKPITAPVRRLAGDMATIGKGEILLLS